MAWVMGQGTNLGPSEVGISLAFSGKGAVWGKGYLHSWFYTQRVSTVKGSSKWFKKERLYSSVPKRMVETCETDRMNYFHAPSPGVERSPSCNYQSMLCCLPGLMLICGEESDEQGGPGPWCGPRFPWTTCRLLTTPSCPLYHLPFFLILMLQLEWFGAHLRASAWSSARAVRDRVSIYFHKFQERVFLQMGLDFRTLYLCAFW